MILIHCALLSEAQYIIEKEKLKLKQKNPRIYLNNKIVLVVSNIGQLNTTTTLEFIYQNYKISKAINIGIAGCNDKSVKIGALFCTNHQLENIPYIQLQTVNSAQLPTSHFSLPTLFDMEGKYFIELSNKYLDKKNIFIFKVVSDHLDDTIPSKEFVKQLIKKNIKSIEKWI